MTERKKSRAGENSADRYLKVFLESSPGSCCLLDEKDRVVYANRLLVRFFGSKAGPVAGAPLMKLLREAMKKKNGKNSLPLVSVSEKKKKLLGDPLAPGRHILLQRSPFTTDTKRKMQILHLIISEKAGTEKDKVKPRLPGLPKNDPQHELLRIAMENLNVSFSLLDRDLRIVALNKGTVGLAQTVYGVKPEPGHFFQDIADPVTQKKMLPLLRRAFKGKQVLFQNRFERKNKPPVYVNIVLRPVYSGKKTVQYVFVSAVDASELTVSRRNEANLYGQLISTLENNNDGFASIDSGRKVTYWNRMAELLTGVPRIQIQGKSISNVFPMGTDSAYSNAIREVFKTKKHVHFANTSSRYGRSFDLNLYPAGKGIAIFFRDVTSSKLADQLIKDAKDRYDIVAQATSDVIWDRNLVNDDLYWAESFYQFFGYPRKPGIASWATWTENIHPDDRKRVTDSILAVIRSDSPGHWEAEYRFRKYSGQYINIFDRGVVMCNAAGKPVRMIGSMQDVTVLKEQENKLMELNEVLNKRAVELARSNAELEQFAYVASHDLQEPLRMISSFIQLLAKKYEHIFDETAQQYIHFAIDGADRMKKLILDLLEYSKLRSDTERKAQVNIRDVIETVLFTCREQIEFTGAVVDIGRMPMIDANKSQMIQLFQNLISNAIKYRSEEKPLIRINCVEENKYWHFTVSDNGIGLDMRYAEKIFLLFKRLHNKRDYSGTGIGLTICKTIVEHHGGEIWVESEPNKGSVFHFKLKKQE